jgi:hypothetical protein
MTIRIILKRKTDADAEAFSALKMAERGAATLRGTAPEVRRPPTLAEIGAATLRQQPEKARRGPDPERPPQWSPHGRPITLAEDIAARRAAAARVMDAYREIVGDVK